MRFGDFILVSDSVHKLQRLDSLVRSIGQIAHHLGLTFGARVERCYDYRGPLKAICQDPRQLRLLDQVVYRLACLNSLNHPLNRLDRLSQLGQIYQMPRIYLLLRRRFLRARQITNVELHDDIGGRLVRPTCRPNRRSLLTEMQFDLKEAT